MDDDVRLSLGLKKKHHTRHVFTVHVALSIYIQTFLILGIVGMPSTWLDVLTLDLGLDGLLKESPFSLTSFISVFGTLLAFVRPTIPGDSPRMLRTLLPVVAWFLFSDEATVRH